MDKNQMNSHKRPCSKPFVTVLTIKKKHFHGQKTNELSQKATPKTIFHPFDKNNLNYYHGKKSNEFLQKAVSKPFVRL